MALDLGNLFFTPEDEVKQEEEVLQEEEVVEQPEETEEEAPQEKEVVEQPTVEVPELPDTEEEDEEEEEEKEVKKEKTPQEKAIKFLVKQWGTHGVTEEQLQSEDFSHIVEAVAKLQEENDRLKADKKALEKHPVVQEAKVQQKIQKLWDENISDWNTELSIAIPDEIKLASKLGKKKVEEVLEFVQKESRALLEAGLKSGKKISNPLTILAPKIAKKIQEASGTQPEAKPKADPKKMMSLQGGAATKQQAASIAPQKEIQPEGLTPLQAKLLNNMRIGQV